MAHQATLPILLRELRLPTMARHWEAFLSKAEQEHWNPARYLSALCEQEINERHSRRIARFTKESRLPSGKTLSSFDFIQTPGIRAERVEAFATNTDWVKRAENLLLFGPSGVGKTHLAAAISAGLIQQGVRVRYYAATAIVQELQKARDELRMEDLLERLNKYRVLIIDDLGYVRKSESETHALFELIAHRYETGSMIVTSNQPFSQWDHIFVDPVMTVAAIDRMVHHATIIEIQAESFRRRQAVAVNGRSTAEAATLTGTSTSITSSANTTIRAIQDPEKGKKGINDTPPPLG